MKNIFKSIIVALAIACASITGAYAQISVTPSRLEWTAGSTELKYVRIECPTGWETESLYPGDGAFAMTCRHGEGDMTIGIVPSSANTTSSDRTATVYFYNEYDDYCVLELFQAAGGQSVPGGSDPPAQEDQSWTEGLSRDRSYVEKVTFTSGGASPRAFRDVTYYDGLGYASQQIGIAASGSGKSIIQPIVYDAMHRADALTYQPYASSDGSAAFIPTASAISALTAFHQDRHWDSHPFSINDYEPWSGGRIRSSRKAGDAWADSDSRATVTRRGYSASGDHIMKASYIPSTVSSNGRPQVSFSAPGSGYADGALTVVVSQNEHGDAQTVFTDAMGRTVCTRADDGNGGLADTYYAYDLKDSLVCVLQPEGSALMAGRAERTVTLSESAAYGNSDIYDRFCFSWKYDSWGNILESHVPGGGTTYCTYDDRHRLVSERTPRMNELSVTRVMTYDSCDRPVSEVLRKDATGTNIALHSWEYYPFGTSAQVGSRGLLRSETIWDAPAVGHIPPAMLSARSRVTRTYAYDPEGRVIRLLESWSDGWSSDILTSYDLQGNVTSVTETHTETQSEYSHSDVLRTEYSYDARGRRVSCHRYLGDEMLSPVVYRYDELGRLCGKEFGVQWGTEFTQTLSYDVHGWLKETRALCSTDDHLLFSEHLAYASPSTTSTQGRYDGLVSETVRNQAGLGFETYGYSYDGMGRLTDAVHHPGISQSTVNTDTERGICYDRNGNITSLTRYGQTPGEGQALSFNYTGNRLMSAGGSSYAYDSAGNMTSDSAKGLSISYNVANLPSVAQQSDGRSLTYSYLSDGTKVSALLQDGKGRKYRGSFVYRVDAPGVETLESIAWDEGRIVLNPDLLADAVPDDSVAVDDVILDTTACVNAIRDEWHVKDHLGNVRMVVDLNAWDAESAVLEQNDYLPFGTRVSGYGYATLEDNRYRYAGKEEQRLGSADSGMNLGQLDFGARWYDPSICRWTSVDPLAHKYPGLTPYNYCGNDPINRIDPDGRIWDTFWDIASLAYDVGSAAYYKITGDNNAAKKQLKVAGADLAFALIPGASSVYYKAARFVNRGLDAIKLGNELKSFDHAAEFGVDSYKALKRAVIDKVGKGSNLEVHHIIEQRFADKLGVKEYDMPSIVLTKEEHKVFTQKWRDRIGYSNSKNPVNTNTATQDQILDAARNIYKDYPEIMKAVGL